MNEWHFINGGWQFGPVPLAQLKELADSGRLGPDDLVWKEGFENWLPAFTINGLFHEAAVNGFPPVAPQAGAQKPPSSLLACPSCRSDNVQSLKVIHEMGTSSINTTNSDIVLGVGGGAYLGGGFIGSTTGSTQGVQQSAAAAQAAPPVKKVSVGVGGIMLLGGIIALGWCCYDFHVWLIVLGFCLLVIGGRFAEKENKLDEKAWQQTYKKWCKSYRCLKCGQVFESPINAPTSYT